MSWLLSFSPPFSRLPKITFSLRASPFSSCVCVFLLPNPSSPTTYFHPWFFNPLFHFFQVLFLSSWPLCLSVRRSRSSPESLRRRSSVQGLFVVQSSLSCLLLYSIVLLWKSRDLLLWRRRSSTAKSLSFSYSFSFHHHELHFIAVYLAFSTFVLMRKKCSRLQNQQKERMLTTKKKLSGVCFYYSSSITPLLQ